MALAKLLCQAMALLFFQEEKPHKINSIGRKYFNGMESIFLDIVRNPFLIIFFL